MHLADNFFSGAESVLDVGGWFNPEPRATHVVDLMPWETRRAKLSLTALPGERYTKATWFQLDFLRPDLRLPFPDKSFDVVICGQTIEDLVDPAPILREMSRVGRRGVIECPSRLVEQTIGIRDRLSVQPGHPHHHWIVEAVDDSLRLYSKLDSRLCDKKRLLPLSFTERSVGEKAAAAVATYIWTDRIEWKVMAGPECQQRAEAFVEGMRISEFERLTDSGRRFLRRLRKRWRGQAAEDFSWWPRIVEVSRPYSTIELK